MIEQVFLTFKVGAVYRLTHYVTKYYLTSYVQYIKLSTAPGTHVMYYSPVYTASIKQVTITLHLKSSLENLLGHDMFLVVSPNDEEFIGRQ